MILVLMFILDVTGFMIYGLILLIMKCRLYFLIYFSNVLKTNKEIKSFYALLNANCVQIYQ